MVACNSLPPAESEFPMSTVRVTNPGVVIFNGMPTPLKLDDRYDTDDAIVREFPHMFGFDNDETSVETATAAPGERRQRRA